MKSLESIIATVTLKNIFSYEKAYFEFDKGVTLIEGWNHDDGTPEGSGKSAIPNGLCWGLFGKIPKDAKVDDVIREGAESGGVAIALRDGTEIIRTRRPNDLYYRTPTGAEIRGKDARETQVLIEKLLGFSFETFCQAIYFAQNYPAKFISATEAERAKIISEIQDLDAFTLARKKVQGLLKAEEVTLVAVQKDVEMHGLLLEQAKKQLSDFTIIRETAAREALGKIADLTTAIELYEAEIAELKTEVDGINPTEVATKLSNVTADLFTLQNQINALKVELGSLKDAERQHELTRSDLERMDKEAVRVRDEVAKLTQAIDAIDLEALTAQEATITSDIGQLEEVRAQIKASLLSLQDAQRNRLRVRAQHAKKLDEVRAQAKTWDEFSKAKQKLCPTCGTPMNAEHVAKHREESQRQAEKLLSELEELKRQLDECGEDKDPKDLESELAELDLGIQAAKRERGALEKIRYSLDGSRKNLNVLLARERSLDREQAMLRDRLAAFKPANPEDLKARLTEAEGAHKALKELEDLFQAALLRTRDLDRNIVAKKREVNRLIGLRKEEEGRDTSGIDEKIELLETDISMRGVTLSDRQKEASQLQLLVAQYTTLKDAFQEVKQYVFRGLLTELTKKANRYAVELFEVPVAIKFSNEDEGGEVSKILASVILDGSERPLGLLSGGQFRRVSLAVDLALSEIISGRSHNPAQLRILDEPFKDLSETSMERALKLFDNLPGATVLIEHNSMAKAIVNNSIKVELRDGVSRIIE